MEPVKSGDTAGPEWRFKFGASATARGPVDQQADPYGNDRISIGQSGEEAQTTVLDGGEEFGAAVETEVVSPIGLGLEYELGVLPTLSTTNNVAGENVTIDQSNLALENSLRLSYTPVGNGPDDRFRLTFDAGATLISVQRDKTVFDLSGGASAPKESSYFDNNIGVSGGVELGVRLYGGLGLEASGTIGYYGDAGTAWGANLGLTYTL